MYIDRGHAYRQPKFRLGAAQELHPKRPSEELNAGGMRASPRVGTAIHRIPSYERNKAMIGSRSFGMRRCASQGGTHACRFVVFLSVLPQPYYEGLFAIADQGRTGHIGGKDAVAFLSRSKLPVDLLRDIWTMSDSPKSNSLDRANFYVAIRLIQLYQNGQSAQDVNLLAAAGVVMRPPYFEGVSGVSVPLPGAAAAPGAAPATQAPTGPATTPAAQQQPQQQQQQPSFQQQNGYQQQQTAQPTPQQQPLPLSQMAMQQQPHYLSVPQQPPQSTALTTQDLYVMFPHERSRYEAIFPQYEVKKDGFVYGGEAVALFSKSGLEKDQLRDVWNVVDEPVDNRLDRLEFAIAMHLIVCISKKSDAAAAPLSIRSATASAEHSTYNARPVCHVSARAVTL